jgi:hypothetical protein
MAGLVVVVAEHGDRRHVQGGELAREDPSFFSLTGIGQIAGKQQHVRRLGHLTEQCLQRAL